MVSLVLSVALACMGGFAIILAATVDTWDGGDTALFCVGMVVLTLGASSAGYDSHRLKTDGCDALLSMARTHEDSLTVVRVRPPCLWERADTVGLGEITP